MDLSADRRTTYHEDKNVGTYYWQPYRVLHNRRKPFLNTPRIRHKATPNIYQRKKSVQTYGSVRPRVCVLCVQLSEELIRCKIGKYLSS